MISRISLIFLLTIMVFVGGCADNEMGRQSGWRWPLFKSTLRVRNPIVNKTDYWIQKEVVAEEEFPGPTPQDLKSPAGDYITGPADRLMVRIFELMAPGQPADFDVRISEIGQVTLPYLGTIKVGGLTTRGIEEKLADLLEPDYLKDPQVTVFVLEYSNRMVTLISGVMRPGMYPLMKHDTTLLEILAQAGGVLQGTEPYGYVIRLYKPDEADILMPGGVAKEEKPAEAIPEVEEPAEAAEEPVEAAPEAEKPAKAAEKPAEAIPEVEKPAKAAEKPAEAAPEAEEPAQEVTPAEEKPAEVKEKPAEVEAEEGPAELPAQPPGGGGLSPEMIEKEIERLKALAEGEMEDEEPAEERPIKEEVPEIPAPEPPPAEPKEPAEPEALPEAAPKPIQAKVEDLSRWMWIDGKWVEVPAKPKDTEEPDGAELAEGAKPAEDEAPGEGKAPPETELERKLRRLGVITGGVELKRIIRIDIDALQAGDPTQNIVMRNSDFINIPLPPAGEFYMDGHVVRRGVYSLTGRKITVLQAIAAAGGLDQVAVPWRTELIRRVSDEAEEIIYLDLDKIAAGEAPDMYLQADDLIRVGSDQKAIFDAVVRNAFRATYGLGFVYDMNFANFYPWKSDVSPIFGD